MGKLIVIEGNDGSGKSTQYAMLADRMEREGISIRRISFPRYKEESSALVREYLGGKYGTKPLDVNPYAASTFYAVDRFASYKTEWERFYREGGIVIADRWTTSNACHQGAKFEGKDRDDFLDWLYSFEFGLLSLPEPSLVIYLDAELKSSEDRLRGREAATDTKADIHERDSEYLARSLSAGRYACDHYGWTRITCVKDGAMRTIGDIHDEIYKITMKNIR